MSTTTTRFDLYQTVTDRIITLLEQGVIPWKKPWLDTGPPINAISKRKYHGVNVWLLLSLPYSQQQYLTFDQLKRVGGSVKRGEKGHLVVYRALLEDKSKENGAPPTEAEKKYAMRYHVLFNVEQCTNIPESILFTSYKHPPDPIAACDELVANMQQAPKITFTKQLAFYHIADDYVNMPKRKTFKSAEGYYHTLFHELVHSTGHETRLHRSSITDMAEFGSEPYSFEELIAELGASYLSSHVGITHDIENSSAYIQAWLKELRGDKRLIISASAAAQRATNFILGVKSEEDQEKKE